MIGPAGSGKTTLLETIAGDHAADVGGAFVLERRRRDARAARAARLGHRLPARLPVSASLRSRQNIAYGARDADVRRDVATRIRRGDAAATARWAHCRGGERQLVALARALARRPDDAAARRAVQRARPAAPDARAAQRARVARERGLTVLQVTHDFTEAGSARRRGDPARSGPRGVQHGPPSVFASRRRRTSPISRRRECVCGGGCGT